MSWRSKYEALKQSFYESKRINGNLKVEIIKLNKAKFDAEVFHNGVVNIVEYQDKRIAKLEKALLAVVHELEAWSLTESDPETRRVMKIARKVLAKIAGDNNERR